MSAVHPTHADLADMTEAPRMTLRRRLYRSLLDPHNPGNHHDAIDRSIAALIIANLFALLFEHVPAIHEAYAAWFHGFDVASVVIFTTEYLMRLYLAPEDEEFARSRWRRLAYLRSPYALVDLVSILPFYLSMFFALDLRMLRALRLLRIFKLMRVLVPAVARPLSSVAAGAVCARAPNVTPDSNKPVPTVRNMSFAGNALTRTRFRRFFLNWAMYYLQGME